MRGGIANQVAPVRERGLKLLCFAGQAETFGRSRKGAWIEIVVAPSVSDSVPSRSRKGAWIEIELTKVGITLAKRRSRKGAWIEICPLIGREVGQAVAPVRERGLKYTP